MTIKSYDDKSDEYYVSDTLVKLVDKDIRAADPYSRYVESRVLTIGDEPQCLELVFTGALPEHETDTFHEVTGDEAGRLALISYKAYGTISLWWVIAAANGIRYPLDEVVPGVSLRIPAIASVFGDMLRR